MHRWQIDNDIYKGRRMKIKTKIRLTIGLCIIAFFVLQLAIMNFNRMGVYTFNGVLMAIQFVLCLLMVQVDHKWGAIISYGLLLISGIVTTLVIVLQKLLYPLPGLCNLTIYFVTLILLNRQLIIRDREAVTDYLTGLRNRRGLSNFLRRKIEDDKPFHVVYIDLGNFKLINDNYGHAYGDLLLKTVAERMSKILYRDEALTRIGGDEFVLVLNGYRNAVEVAKEALEQICEKIILDKDKSDVETYLTAYAGISSFPKDTKDAEALIKYADIAMYQASKTRTENISIFNKEMEQKLIREMEVEKLIKEALEKNYFYMVYQPQYKLGGKKLRGFESLLRMKTPDGQFVSPGEFIPVAEKSDLALQIDDYVLQHAMLQFRDAIKKNNADIVISINVSAKNIANLDFPDKIKRIIDRIDFPADHLEIEITEYCLVQSVDITIDNIMKLREMGIQVALDDFGTGYTSLSYLAKMPINLLKIDKSLIDEIESDEKKREFVSAVISLGHLMGCEVISEGVEYEEQLSLLLDHDCDFVQGFVWGKPMSYEDAKSLIQC